MTIALATVTVLSFIAMISVSLAHKNLKESTQNYLERYIESTNLIDTKIKDFEHQLDWAKKDYENSGKNIQRKLLYNEIERLKSIISELKHIRGGRV